MTKLEAAMENGIKAAHKQYEKMTDGYWLNHAPEHFVQVFMSIKISNEAKYLVYPDVSLKKSKSEMKTIENTVGKEEARAYFNLRQRPDLLVWEKTTGNILAIIEIKWARRISRFRKDAEKLANVLESDLNPKNAYIVVYSDFPYEKREPDPAERLKNTFRDWSDQLGWSLAGSYVSPVSVDRDAWGFCFLRKTRSKRSD